MAKKFGSGMAYKMSTLNKIFAFLSFGLFLTVLWVFLDDYMRPWKAVQLEGMQIQKQKFEETIAKKKAELKQREINDAKASVAEAKAVVASREEKISSLNEELLKIKDQLKKQNLINGQLNAQVAALTFQWESAHAKKKPKAPKLYKSLRKNKALFAESKDRVKFLQGEEKRVNRAIRKSRAVLTNAQKGLDKLVGSVDRLISAKAKTEISPVFILRNMPFIDYLDPTIKIQQVVVDRVNDDRYFKHVPKVDRCITCHMFSDQPGYEDQANPFKTHPKLDLMVGKNSPHKMKEFGCTSCHGGEGHRVNDFNSIAHMPQNDAQQKEWEEKYGWHRPHKVPQVMLRLGQTEAACIKCHQGVEVIPGATVVNKGREHLEKYGCYACHKIKGWEHKRDPGPSLNKIAGKTTKEFFKSWVWSPMSFNKHAKMPSFFMQSNNKVEKFAKYNVAEVNAMAEYFWEKSEKYRPFAKYSKGNIQKGKELISEVGCLSCHGVEGLEEDSKKINAHAGPYLTGIGSKVNPDWLVSWLKRPSHYHKETIMPSFRLSDRETNNIAAYLLSLKNKTFEQLKFSDLNKQHRDKILLDYFGAFDTEKVARQKLAKMSDRDRTLELGHRSIGKYGCYSCHNIKGFEGRAPIGPELTKVGSKPIEQFGFAHENVPHERDAWIQAHLINPRRWDNGVDKPFKDLLRMPNFYMSKKEAKEITVSLLGQVSEVIPSKGMKSLDSREARVERGRKIVHKYNCMGCHKVDGERGDILSKYEDDINEGPPRLNGEGHRIRTTWLHNFLDNVHTIRPWLKVRMPSYNLTNEEKNLIIEYFQHKSSMKTFVELPKKVQWLPEERKAALKLFENMACASCHAQGFNKEEPMAPNLYHAKVRLRPTWIKKWLLDPQAIMPGTSMPSFWEDGESSEPDILGGDTTRQIEALTKYIIEIGQDKFPVPLRKNVVR